MPSPSYLKHTIHNQLRRAVWHNYYGKAVYMVTISKNGSCPPFGTLIYTNPNDAYIQLSSCGEIIKKQIEITPAYHPQLKILSYVIMPDHAHILIFVTEPIEKHFGDIIQAMKSSSTSEIRKILDRRDIIVFEEGFNDRIVKSRHQLEILYRYLRDNPHSLAMRKSHPEYFRRINALKIGGNSYQAYGNFQLLDCPFKEQVVIHRADTADERERKRQLWTYTAANGGVLVSPFISKAEKEVRSDAEVAGGRFILIVNEPMEERYKPSGHDFELCEAGRLLIISANLPGEISRQSCLTMNSLAETIAKN